MPLYCMRSICCLHSVHWWQLRTLLKCWCRNMSTRIDSLICCNVYTNSLDTTKFPAGSHGCECLVLTVEIAANAGYLLFNVVYIQQNFGECAKSRSCVRFSFSNISGIFHVDGQIPLDISTNTHTNRFCYTSLYSTMQLRTPTGTRTDDPKITKRAC